MKNILQTIFFFFFAFAFEDHTVVYGSSQDRDSVWAEAANYAAAGTMPGPLTHYTRPEIEPLPPQWTELL